MTHHAPLSEGSGLVQIDMVAGKVVKTQDYYTLGQWSKFVPRGAKYMNTTGSYDYPDGTGVQANTFANPDGMQTQLHTNDVTASVLIDRTLIR